MLCANYAESILRFFGAGLTRFRYRITPEGPASVQKVTEWVLLFHESDHAEFGGVYIFNSKYWGKKRIDIEFFIKNQIEIESRGKNHNHRISK